MFQSAELNEIINANRDLLASLHEKPCSTVELAALVACSEEEALVAVRTCRAHGLVEVERRGRVIVNRLTREAQTLLDKDAAIKSQPVLG